MLLYALYGHHYQQSNVKRLKLIAVMKSGVTITLQIPQTFVITIISYTVLEIKLIQTLVVITIILAMPFCESVQFDPLSSFSYFGRTDLINPLTFQQLHKKNQLCLKNREVLSILTL